MTDAPKSAPQDGDPSPRKRRRFNRWEDRFLEALRRKGSVEAAALEVGIGKTTVYRMYHRNEKFAAAWREIIESGNAMLEGAAFERAVHGVERHKYHQGVVCGTEREYSDPLTQFLLEKRMPQRYGRAAVDPSDDAQRVAKLMEAIQAMRATVQPPPDVAALRAELEALRAELAQLRGAPPTPPHAGDAVP